MRITHIFYSSHFLRAMKRLGKEYAGIVEERQAMFKADCFDPRLKTHKLHGKLKKFYSFSITHSHCILFALNHDGTAEFVDVGDHVLYQ